MLNQSIKEELIASKRALQNLSRTPTETTHTFYFIYLFLIKTELL